MKAISPVIATVIIVAVAIAISIAVALWLTGIVGGFTTVENLQITYAYANKTNNAWEINLRVENKGTGTATIDEIFVNNMPHLQANAEVFVGNNNNRTGNISISINPGEGVSITIKLPGGRFSSGQQVEIKLHTASGKEYPKMVTLP